MGGSVTVGDLVQGVGRRRPTVSGVMGKLNGTTLYTV